MAQTDPLKTGELAIPYYILVDRQGKAEGRPDIRDHTRYVEAIKSKL